MDRIRFAWAMCAVATIAGPRVGLARAGDPAAGAMLEGKGLVRGASGFVLASESDVKGKLGELKPRASQSYAANAELGAIRQAVARLDGLEFSEIQINKEIGGLDFQMSQYPSTRWRGQWIRGTNQQEHADFLSIKAQRDQAVAILKTEVIPDRDLLRKQAPRRSLGAATDTAKIRHEAALYTLNEARDAVAATTKGYKALSQDAEVQRALKAVGQPNIGPSPEFIANVQILAQFEKSVGMKPSSIDPKPADPPRTNRPAPGSDRAEQLYRIAEMTEKNRNVKGAITNYQDVIKRSPGTQAAKRAAERIKALTPK